MDRLTTNKDVTEMGMYELAHNGCYIDENGNARYRDFEKDYDARDLVRHLMVEYGQWKRLSSDGLDVNNEIYDDDIFDDTMIVNLMFPPTSLEGLIALFYRNIWSMAELREKLKFYEDAEEQGLLLRLPCKVGDKVWIITSTANYSLGAYREVPLKHPQEKKIQSITVTKKVILYHVKDRTYSELDFGKTVFLTKEEAEQTLTKMKEGEK